MQRGSLLRCREDVQAGDIFIDALVACTRHQRRDQKTVLIASFFDAPVGGMVRIDEPDPIVCGASHAREGLLREWSVEGPVRRRAALMNPIATLTHVLSVTPSSLAHLVARGYPRFPPSRASRQTRVSAYAVET